MDSGKPPPGLGRLRSRTFRRATLIDALRTIAGNPTQDFDAMWGKRTTYWFMDDWTIFYWGWWISWAPFVGMFIARISRGRTVGQGHQGRVRRPVSVWILLPDHSRFSRNKMQRIAEMAIDKCKRPDSTGELRRVRLPCSLGFQLRPARNDEHDCDWIEASRDQGYYALSCETPRTTFSAIVEHRTASWRDRSKR